MRNSVCSIIVNCFYLFDYSKLFMIVRLNEELYLFIILAQIVPVCSVNGTTVPDYRKLLEYFTVVGIKMH